MKNMIQVGYDTHLYSDSKVTNITNFVQIITNF